MTLAALSSQAAVVTLTFEGLGDQERVLNFYNGGTGGSGSGPGANYNIAFGSDALSIIDADAGGNGNFANEPTPNTILFFLTGPGAIMNVPAGFIDGFSFYYSAAFNPGVVTVYDGIDGSGNVLATLNLPVNGSGCGGDPTGQFNCWDPIGVPFAGTALSVNFSGTANQIGFDNITLGSEIPTAGTPEPASLALTAAGIVLAYLRRRRAVSRRA